MYCSDRSHPARRGTVVPMVAVCLVALFAMTGLVVDGGLIMGERRHAQAAADSAALAGAQDMLVGPNRSSQARVSALRYAASQGYTNDGTTSTVTVNIPPASGPNVGDPDKIEVLTGYEKPVFFIGAITGASTAHVGARAVAGVTREVANPNSLVALGPKGSGTLTLTGTGIVSANGGGVQVNSTAPDALLIKGTASGIAKSWSVAGGYATVAGTPTPGGGGGSGTGTFSPTPQTGVSPIADPLRNLAPPSVVGPSIKAGVALTGSQSATLSPGVYVGGISASGGSSLTLTPGVYIIQGGGLSVTDTAAFSARGVTIYNTGTSLTYGPITLTSPNTSFTAPTSGAYQGLMFYQDPQNTLAASFSDPQSGGLSGTFYFPTAGVTYNANGGAVSNLQLIADHITINTDTPSGNADLNIPYNASKFARPPQIYILE
ncbi:MAG: pilus assembly protein TadG-related protein [Isosphaeraceae bacterium]